MRLLIVLQCNVLIELTHCDYNHNNDNNGYDKGHLKIHATVMDWERVENIKLYRHKQLCPGDQPWDQKSWDPFRLRWKRFSKRETDILTEIMQETVLQFRHMFNVRRSLYPIGLEGGDCNDPRMVFKDHVVIQRCVHDHPNGTLGADFMLYVRAADTRSCGGGTLAYAQPCAHDANGRPIFGIINLCRENLKFEKWDRLSLTKTLQHELIHALGFYGQTMNELKYVENGKEKSGRKRVFRQWKINSKETRIHEALLIPSPKVKEVVRKHFNCFDLEGAELENEGGGGTHHVHWEKRLFGGETMTGYSSRRSYISDLTLAFFEDTGWYKPNYSLAEPFSFGKGAGCVFARGSCRDYLDSKKDGSLMLVPAAAKPYCNWGDYVEKKKLKSTVRECSTDRQYYSSCDWNEAKDKDVNKNKTYFADKWAIIDGVNITGRNIYGYSAVMDGCPQWVEHSYGPGGKKFGDSVCINPHSQPPAENNIGAELFGADSICLKQEGKFEVYQCLPFGISLYYTEHGHHGAGCYRYKCEDGRLMIQANYSQDDSKHNLYMKQYKICWSPGAVIHIRRHQNSGPNGRQRFHKGVVVCPSCEELCETGRWGDFKCKPDIWLDSKDYSPLPCRGYFAKGSVAAYLITFVFMLVM